MESLPDELFLLIFRYLHRFDLLHAFKDLNQRFRQLVEPYLNDIDLIQTNLSYTHFRLFIKHILPFEGNAIRSLTVSGIQLFDLIRSRLHYLTSLEAFTLKPPLTDIVLPDELDLCLIQVLQMPTLKRLSIYVYRSRILESISEYATPNLQTLEVLHSDKIYYFKDVMQHIPYLRRVSINLTSIADLIQLFRIMINLKELNLSLYNFDGLKIMKIPDTLEKLHLEIDFHQMKSKHQKNSLYRPYLDILSKLLSNFRNNLRYLSVIIFNAEEEFSDFDKFHNLVNHFDHLETFAYDIHTKYRPD